MEKKDKIMFNFVPNALKSDAIKKQVEDQWKADLLNRVPQILEREAKIKPLLSDKIGDYYNLLKEARECFDLGLFYSTVAMVGISAEKFAADLFENVTYHVNGNPILEKDLLGERDRISHFKRLVILHKAGILNDNEYEKLEKIRLKRNDYIHSKSEINPEQDSLEMLNLMIDVMAEGFFDRYEIKEGKFVRK